MVQDTKLTFSKEELNALHNSRFFEVKHEATQKIIQLLGAMEQELMKKIFDFSFLQNKELQIKEKGKIFRGENYRLMPYIILDCPRVFSAETVFAFRSMFRWGNEFSFTLHLQGNALEVFRKKIQTNIFLLKQQNFFICVNNTPWEYTFDEKNYIPLDTMLQKNSDEVNEMISTKNFLKLSRKLELNEYYNALSFGVETFEKVMKILE